MSQFLRFSRCDVSMEANDSCQILMKSEVTFL